MKRTIMMTAFALLLPLGGCDQPEKAEAGSETNRGSSLFKAEPPGPDREGTREKETPEPKGTPTGIEKEQQKEREKGCRERGGC